MSLYKTLHPIPIPYLRVKNVLSTLLVVLKNSRPNLVVVASSFGILIKCVLERFSRRIILSCVASDYDSRTPG